MMEYFLVKLSFEKKNLLKEKKNTGNRNESFYYQLLVQVQCMVRGGTNIIALFVLQPFVRLFNLIDWLRHPREKYLATFSKKIVLECEEKVTKDDNIQNKLFIERLIAMKNNPSILNVNDVHHVSQMLSAAVDTTTLTAINIILQLAMNPEIQEKCFAEIKSIWIDQKSSIDLDMINQMTYLTMTIKECIRLIPTAVGSGKKTTNTIDFGN